MNTTTKVGITGAKSFALPIDHDLQPSYATVYNIPERPRVRSPQLSVLRYEECPTITVSEPDEEYCLTGYGDVSISEYYHTSEAGEDEQKLRVPRLKHARPRAQCQTNKAVSDPVSRYDSDDLGELLLTGDVRQLEPECFRNTIKATSDDPPTTPDTDFREFFENLLRKTPPVRRRNRTLILPTAPASEAIDARPRSN
ncbi:hypothetical protein BDM02DRAFT_3127890 [Thelephora ganbajun]|uniref:Uncharacterized protein n=1 Tax=Thelephora ganbajun TaxID=370292 RepID=A0ACB6ZL37_THEGA|nr:hypothetical protein BDM02DRAFT_3127890 [Thelephora ganbajun]